MSKQTFLQELSDYEHRGGRLTFTFGDVVLPVIFRPVLGILSVKMPKSEVFLPVDYNLDFMDNLAQLEDKLLARYPQLSVPRG